jgi:hypothetical protein
MYGLPAVSYHVCLQASFLAVQVTFTEECHPVAPLLQPAAEHAAGSVLCLASEVALLCKQASALRVHGFCT